MFLANGADIDGAGAKYCAPTSRERTNKTGVAIFGVRSVALMVWGQRKISGGGILKI